MNITTSELTQSKLEQLICKDNSDDMPFSIFVFAYNAYKAEKESGESFDIDTEELAEVFKTYQLYLNIEVFKRQGVAKFDGIKIFDFDNYQDDMAVTFN
ncbi:MAG: hypothetical protein ACK5NF_02280 [Bacilli bacterium]